MITLADDVIRILAEASIRVVVLTAIVAAIIATLRVRSDSTRHAAWTVVLVAMLAMPILPYGVPSLTIPVAKTLEFDAIPPPPRGDHAPAASASNPASTSPSTGHDPESALPHRQTDTTEVPSLPVRDASSNGRSTLPIVLIAMLYVAGVLVAATHVSLGWLGARRLARAGTRVLVDDGSPVERHVERNDVDPPVVESPLVTTPVTIGIVAPTIVLPISWRTWPAPTLRAVLAHEGAHIDRRDSLIAFVARLNRCLFWFHPIAWWLERALAAAAEHASDERAVRVVGDSRRYAEVLVTMARIASTQGRRWSWQGVGMTGTSLLGRRINRVLREHRPRSSAAQSLALAVACATSVFLVAACRLQASPKPWELTRAEEQREQKLRTDLELFSPARLVRIRPASDDDYARLEAAGTDFEHDPGGLEHFEQWLNTYWSHGGQSSPAANRRDAVTSQKLITMRRAGILWVIEQHPESALAGSVVARLFPTPRDLAFPGDPAGYAQARALWLAQADKPDASPIVLGNASYFLESADRPIAERLLLRAHALDPQGPWTVRLGRLYALSLTGSTVVGPSGIFRFILRSDAKDPFAVLVRRTLGESHDDQLLTAAGWFMARATRYPEMEFDPFVGAQWCFKRALQLNPKAVLAHSELIGTSRNRLRASPPVWTPPASQRYQWVSTLPEPERFEELVRESTPFTSQEHRWSDPNLAEYDRINRENAHRFAEDLLKLAPTFRNHPQYGMALYAANMTLGSLALAEGDKAKAIDHLRKASRATASDELIYDRGLATGWRYPLARDLFSRGEHEVVAQFMEQMADISLVDRMELREKAAAIRRGESPF